MSEGDHFTTFDLSSGYHDIEMHPEHQKYVGFEWTYEDGSTKFFSFVFYHLVRHQNVTFLQRFYTHLLSAGEVIIHIDGGIAASLSFELSKTGGELSKNDLVSARICT